MGRTRAAVPVPEPERTPRWWLAWAVPAAAAATAVAIWVAVPRPTNVTVSRAAAPVQQQEVSPQSTTPAPAAPKAEPAAPPVRPPASNLQDRARKAEAPPPVAREAANDAAQPTPGNVNEGVSVRSAAPATGATERRDEAERPNAAAGQLQARAAFATSLCGPMWPPPPSDIASQITAGNSPSADVCWIVGRAGTVLRSTDHQTWQRMSVPQPVDLARITATDGRTATVVASESDHSP